MKSTIVKSLLYQLSATMFTQEDCNKLIHSVLDAVYSKEKLSRKFLFDLYYSLSNWLGLELDDLYIYQECKKVVFFIK